MGYLFNLVDENVSVKRFLKLKPGQLETLFKKVPITSLSSDCLDINSEQSFMEFLEVFKLMQNYEFSLKMSNFALKTAEMEMMIEQNMKIIYVDTGALDWRQNMDG